MQLLRSSMARLGRTIFVLCAALALTGLLAACGTGGASGGGVTSAANKGNLAVVLTFPQATAAHPHGTPQVGANLFGTTQSVIVELLDPNDKTHVIATEKANRNGQDKLTVTFDNVALGNYLVYVLCYDGVDQTGNVSAVALPPVTVVAGTTEVPISETQNAAVVTSLAVTPNPATVNVNDTIQMTATATLSDNSQVDVTQLSIWSKATTPPTQIVGAIAGDISVEPTTGVVKGLSFGLRPVQAAFAGFTAQASVHIGEIGIYFDVTPHTLPALVSQTYTANQTYNLTAFQLKVPATYTPVDNDPNTMTVQVGYLNAGTFVPVTDGSYGSVTFTNGHWVYTAPATPPINSIILDTATPYEAKHVQLTVSDA